ncbi:hypothetical protein RND71_028604 [Anisodus tanguticus]|uniref:Uncharacterized protein n=1 Tax=Anisodus tanguticus TaxID=243964 RepID=A0AAE1RK23_9SOLA|nr:hypothetical protein RND71_028604 [Anisodus tanguticus]
MERESSHAPRKGLEVQGTEPHANKAPHTKEIPVSSEDMIPIDQLKEFIEWTIKNKKMMVRILREQKLVERPKKTKVEVEHYQKPRRSVTLEEFFPSWFITTTARDSIEAS